MYSFATLIVNLFLDTNILLLIFGFVGFNFYFVIIFGLFTLILKLSGIDPEDEIKKSFSKVDLWVMMGITLLVISINIFLK